jgi:hypothetical protein
MRSTLPSPFTSAQRCWARSKPSLTLIWFGIVDGMVCSSLGLLSQPALRPLGYMQMYYCRRRVSAFAALEFVEKVLRK